jgi:hypothetical protein
MFLLFSQLRDGELRELRVQARVRGGVPAGGVRLRALLQRELARQAAPAGGGQHPGHQGLRQGESLNSELLWLLYYCSSLAAKPCVFYAVPEEQTVRF